MKKEELDIESLVRIESKLYESLVSDRIRYINHPKHGVCKTIFGGIYTQTRNLTKGEKKEYDEL